MVVYACNPAHRAAGCKRDGLEASAVAMRPTPAGPTSARGRKPQSPVGAAGDAGADCVAGAQRKLRRLSAGRDAADCVRALFGKPQGHLAKHNRRSRTAPARKASGAPPVRLFHLASIAGSSGPRVPRHAVGTSMRRSRCSSSQSQVSAKASLPSRKSTRRAPAKLFSRNITATRSPANR